MKVKDLISLLKNAPQDAELELVLYHEMTLVSKVCDVYSVDVYDLQNVYIPFIGEKVYLSSVVYLDSLLHETDSSSL